MATRKIIVTQCYCERCGHLWEPRKKDLPTICPVCKRRTWNDPK